jgi:putative hydrolase of the HAD superfamily
VLGFEGPTIVSSDIGVQKPDVAAFDILVSTLGAPREACWYVGDDPKTDIAGALDAGLQAVWLDAEGAGYPERAAEPTLTIHHLGELLDALQGALAAS